MIDNTQLDELIEEHELVTWDGCDDAIVGVVGRCGEGPLVLYDRDLLLKVFMDGGHTYEEADEWVSFNIEGAYVGKQTPMIMEGLEREGTITFQPDFLKE